jgi:hypothetical protein
MALQACSASTSILMGEPPILNAPLPPIARRHDAT